MFVFKCLKFIFKKKENLRLRKVSSCHHMSGYQHDVHIWMQLGFLAKANKCDKKIEKKTCNQ